MKRNVSKSFVRINYLLVLPVLFMAITLGYVLWTESSRVSDLESKILESNLDQFAKSISLAVKVQDTIQVHKAFANSSLSKKINWVEVYDRNKESIYANISIPEDCSGMYKTKLLDFQGQNNGEMRVCFKKNAINTNSKTWVVVFVMAMFLIFVMFLMYQGYRYTSQVSLLLEYIKSINLNERTTEKLTYDIDSHFSGVYKILDDVRDEAIEKREAQEKMKVHEAVSEKVRSIAHDIRSPLMYAEALINHDKSLEPEFRQKLLKNIFRVYEAAESLLGRYPKKRIEKLDIQKPETFTSFWEEKLVEYDEKDVDFNSYLDWNSLDDVVDIEGFKFSVSNILNNAVEAAEENDGTVTVISFVKNGVITVEVADSGPGIPKEILSSLGKEEITTKPKGNGIGVISAFKFFESINGSLEINTSSKGTRVSMAFPVKDASESNSEALKKIIPIQ